MADGEAEQESGPGPDLAIEIPRLEERLQVLEGLLREGAEEAVQAAADYCQRFCQTLLEYAEKWKANEDSLSLLEVYTVAIQNYAKARPYLTSECEHVALVLERLALSCVELLLCLPHELSYDRWQNFQSSIQIAHQTLTENGSQELFLLYTVSKEDGVWKDPVLVKIMDQEALDQRLVDVFFISEGPVLLEMRIKQLLKERKVAPATNLAKMCSDHPDIGKKGNFKQLYLTCLCAASPNIKLIEEIAKVDCKDALDMICNLESDGDEQTSLILCAAFLSRQLQFGEMYCAWELTLFWSKLQRRVDPSIQVYLERCRQLSLLTKTVYHIFFLIKVIQSETEGAGLPTCIELCVRALRLESSENSKVKISVCKTISCLLPNDLEVKRACQLTEFLLEPTVDAYYAVEMLYNQPDQKYEEESLPVPNSLRCELLLVLKTRWPFDPEFWDWKTLKRQCLALMGEEASIVSSIDELNDNEAYDQVDDCQDDTKMTSLNGLGCFDDSSNFCRDMDEMRQKKRNIKKLREQGCVSKRFRNWQAYMQYCVLCDKEFLGHRIVRHAQKHCKDGIYSCPICAKQYNSKESFVPHVTLHVKESCKQRLETMKPLRRLSRLPKTATTSCKNKKSLPIAKKDRRIKKNSLYSDDFIVFNDNDNSDDNDSQYDDLPIDKQVSANEFPCPVQFCTKGFKYFKNLIAHVRGHKDSEEATRFLEMQSKKVICQYCRRQFVSLTHINDHLQMHCGSQPYICIQMKCKASFDTYAELLTHRKEHRIFRARCMFPKCGRVFSAAYMLFDHEAQHYNTFTCKYDGCKKIYHSQLQLEKHLEEHAVEASLQESQSNTTELTEMPNTETTNKPVAIKEEPLTDGYPNTNGNMMPLHSDDIIVPAVAKDSHLPQITLTPKDLSPTSDGLDQNMHLLDNLPPPVEVLHPANVLSTILPLSTVKPSQAPPIPSITNPTNLSTAPNNKTPSVPGGINDILMNQNNQADTGNPNTGCPQLCVLDQSLPVFQDGKISSPTFLNKNKVDCTNSGENQIEENHVMPFNAQIQRSPLCENNLKMTGFEDCVKLENNLPLSFETSSILSSVLTSTPIPPPIHPVPPPVHSVPQTPQKYKCNVEGCTRIYNSIQSIGKHMKSSHPDHYDVFKMERKNRRKKSGGSGKSPNDSQLPCCVLPLVDGTTNPVLQSPVQNCANPIFSNQLQQLASPVFQTPLENLVNPILSSVESIISQSLSKNVAESLLGSEAGNLTNAALTSQLEDLAKAVLPMKFENGSDPFLPIPTENDPLPVLSSLTGSSLAGAGTVNSVFLKGEPDVEASFSKVGDNTDADSSFNLDKSASMLSNSAEKETSDGRTQQLRERKTKHGKRPKTPAIIRDGKFICSRCFRVFTNPRSLGGHLSKRAICKPHNEFDTSHEILQRDGKPSVLASVILSTSPKKNLEPLIQTFNPGTAIPNQSFIQTVSVDNSTTPFLQSGFPHPNVTNFSTCVKKEVIEQTIEMHGIVENRQVPLIVKSDNSMPVNHQINTAILCAATPHIVQTGNIRDEDSKTNDTTTNNCNNAPVFSEADLLKTLENGLCSNTMLNSVVENNCMSTPMNTARVSVISGPQSSESKKKSSSSKKKKKPIDQSATTDVSQDLAKNLLAAVGGQPTSIGGNMQVPAELQSDFSTYGSDFIKNIAKHLNSSDKHFFMSCLNDSLKTSPELQELPLLVPKLEPDESAILPSYTSDSKEQSALQIRTDFTAKAFDLSPDVADMFPLNSNIQTQCSNLQQSQNSVNNVDIMPGDTQSVVSPSSVHHPCIVSNIPVCSVSPTQETEMKPDTQILEIMELVQNLQIVDNSVSETLGVGPASEYHRADALPQASSVIVPNPSLNVLADLTDDDDQKPLIDKSNKPFICQEMDCTYCAMTKDALFKHYAKVHAYTQEKIMEIKKHQLKFAPFKCVVPSCTKTFTRNSNLRAHCQSMHHFTSEQMIRLKIKRPYGRKSVDDIGSPTHEIVNKNTDILNCQEINMDAPMIIKREPELHQEKLKLEEIEPPKVQGNMSPVIMTSMDSQISLIQKSKRGPKIRKDKELKHKQPREKDIPQVNSAYKPYQCVHQGCTAAFTIQQNLILHYQAVHKSDLSMFSLEEDGKEEHDESEYKLIDREFRCMETDCSRIFQEVSSLIQHYMKLHEMIAEEIENAFAFIHVGKFKCDQSHCTSVFTSCTSYMEHLEDFHDLKMKQFKQDGETYKCDIGDCDRVYVTRSNLLRHIFNKHNEKHKERLIRPRKISASDQDNSDEKSSRMPKHKLESDSLDISKTKKNRSIGPVKDLKSAPGPTHVSTLRYGRHTYSLKAKVEALAECSGNYAKQYPCMVRGCPSIVTSEHNVIRHYKCHKLSRTFILKHRKTLIVCKRRVRPKTKMESSNSETTEEPKSEVTEPIIPPVKESNPALIDSSDESTVSTSQQSENEKDEMEELAELFIAKLSNEDSTGSESQARTSSIVSSDFQETSSCQSEPYKDKSNLKRCNKQKYGPQNKKRKVDASDEAFADTSSTLSVEEATDIPTAEDPPSFDLGSFKPMGFEVSFLKFIEESVAKEKKTVEKSCVKTECKTGLQASAEEFSWENTDTDTYLLFVNPSHLPNLDNIRIVLDHKFNDYIDVVVKQLHELKPTVVLQHICWKASNRVAKEQNLDIEGDDIV
ncbi:zinc finger protein 292 [Discoglossus pictus]